MDVLDDSMKSPRTGRKAGLGLLMPLLSANLSAATPRLQKASTGAQVSWARAPVQLGGTRTRDYYVVCMCPCLQKFQGVEVLAPLQLKRLLRKLSVSEILSKGGIARIPISKPQFLFLQNGDTNSIWDFRKC